MDTLKAAGVQVREGERCGNPPSDHLEIRELDGKWSGLVMGHYFHQRYEPNFDEWLLQRFARKSK